MFILYQMRLAALQDRLFRALGPAASVGVTAPRFPFQLVNILPQGTRAQPQTQQQVIVVVLEDDTRLTSVASFLRAYCNILCCCVSLEDGKHFFAPMDVWHCSADNVFRIHSECCGCLRKWHKDLVILCLWCGCWKVHTEVLPQFPAKIY